MRSRSRFGSFGAFGRRRGTRRWSRTATDENFRALTVGTITVLDLWAPWCATCRSFAPVCDAAAVHYEDRVRFASCDIDACRGVADLLGLRSIPTLVVFAADGSEIGRVAGAFPGRQLDRLLERALTPST